MLSILLVMLCLGAKPVAASPAENYSSTLVEDRFFTGQLGLPSHPAVPLSSTAEAMIPDEDHIVVETDCLRVTLNLAGGDVVDVALIPDADPTSPKKPIQRITDGQETQAFLRQALVGEELEAFDLPNCSIHYRCAATHHALEDHATLAVRLDGEATRVDGQCIRLTKTFHFKRGSYLFETEWLIDNQTDKSIDFSVDTQWFLKNDHQPDAVHRIMLSTMKKKCITQSVSATVQAKPFREEIDQGWIAWVCAPFTCAICPLPLEHQTLYGKSDVDASACEVGCRTPVESLAPGENRSIRIPVYCGPMQPAALEAAAKYLSRTIDNGYFGFFVRGLSRFMHVLHNWIRDWRLILLLFTAVVQCLFFPIAYYHNKYLAQKRLLAPRLAKIKEKYADDPKKLMLAEYQFLQAHGVSAWFLSPLWSFAWVGFMQPIVATTYELGSSSLLWLSKLQSPDPYRVLPVLASFSLFALLFQSSYLVSSQKTASEEWIVFSLCAGVFYWLCSKTDAGTLLCIIAAQWILFVMTSGLYRWFRMRPPKILNPQYDVTQRKWILPKNR